MENVLAVRIKDTEAPQRPEQIVELPLIHLETVVRGRTY
jgi:hypothetical protein